MPVPLKFLLIAAEIAQHEKTHQAVKAVWNAGAGAMDRRRNAKTAEPPAQLATPPKPDRTKSSGWRAALDRRWRFRGGQSGDLLRFTYTDEHGLVTQRMVGNWRTEGGELLGYCINRREETAFAVSGIGTWEEIEVRCE